MPRSPNKRPLQSRASTMRNLTMQRRHFQLIAETLANIKPTTSPALDQWNITVEAFARALRSTNGGFDSQRFYDACQPDDETTT